MGGMGSGSSSRHATVESAFKLELATLLAKTPEGGNRFRATMVRFVRHRWCRNHKGGKGEWQASTHARVGRAGQSLVAPSTTASLIRRCQPGPVALNLATAFGSSRKVT